MPDVEKSLVAQPPTANNMPSMIEPKKPLSDDANSSEVAGDTPETEKKGGIKDYFRIFKYADRLDTLLYAIALTGGIAVGAALPLMTLVFGSSTASFNKFAAGQGDAQQFTARINHLVLYFVYLFIARFVIGY
ncbi:hypothetical protein LTR28_009113, partial [Elasticomyces elasticus]